MRGEGAGCHPRAVGGFGASNGSSGVGKSARVAGFGQGDSCIAGSGLNRAKGKEKVIRERRAISQDCDNRPFDLVEEPGAGPE